MRTMRLFKSMKFYFAALLAVVFAGCAFEPQAGGEGNGTVRFGISFESSTRAEATPQINLIEVANGVGVIRSWNSLDEVPAELVLTSGTYTVSVDAGVDSTGFDCAHYSGSSEFTVSAGSDESVEVVCTIDNVLMGVTFDQTVIDNLTDYSVVVAADADNTITFGAEDVARVGYIAYSAKPQALAWTFTATTLKGLPVVANGTIENVKPATEYRLNVKYKLQPLGGVAITIELDEQTEDVTDSFDIYGRAEMKALDFDVAEVQQLRAEPYTISVTAPFDIASICVSSAIFGEEPVELLSESVVEGLVVTQISAVEYTVALPFEYLSTLPAGITDFSFSATDIKGKNANLTASFFVPSLNAIDTWDVWATKAPVSATMPEYTVAVQFGYATEGGEWTLVDPAYDQAAEGYALTLSGLTPSTTYTVGLFVNGTAIGATQTFTTEAAPAILDGDFENWHKSDKTWFPYAEGAAGYWDTGNSGATTLGEDWNITTREEDPRPGSTGSYCAHLQSAYPSLLGIGKFAAGNIYVGKYAGTNGTNGQVDFGQPFTGRPTALRGWYKCNVGEINKTGSGAPVTSGPDRYQIMICLTTGVHRVDTSSSSTFFNCKTDSKVIAYGEILSSESKADWTEFTLPLTYVKEGVRPTHIIIVATASSYGDYFTGSTDSWMCVDDFELIY